MSAEITKSNLYNILKDLGKEYRKRNGKNMPAEIIMTGGAAILAKYGFREQSYDIDAIMQSEQSLKDAAIVIRDKYGLQHNWLNSDFKNTSSYSDKLYQHSKHFREFSNVLEVRIVEPEYLLATKLRSARHYKHDLSDIIGIITEEKTSNPEFTKESVIAAYKDMYGDTPIDKQAMQYMNSAFTMDITEHLIQQVKSLEQNSHSILLNFENKYPNTLNDKNINEILQNLQQKQTPSHRKIHAKNEISDIDKIDPDEKMKLYNPFNNNEKPKNNKQSQKLKLEEKIQKENKKEATRQKINQNHLYDINKLMRNCSPQEISEKQDITNKNDYDISE